MIDILYNKLEETEKEIANLEAQLTRARVKQEVLAELIEEEEAKRNNINGVI